MEAAGDAHEIETHIEDLRGHCAKLRDHAFKIQVDEMKGANRWQKLFRLLGVTAEERSSDLADRLDKLAYEDFEASKAAITMVTALRDALEEVQAALGGSDRVMKAENMSAAGTLLAKHAKAFGEIEKSARLTVKELTALTASLV
jgi:hypothetical protein